MFRADEKQSIPSEIAMNINKYVIDSVTAYKRPVKIINAIAKENFTQNCVDFLSRLENITWNHIPQLKTKDYEMSWFYLKKKLVKKEIEGNFLVVENNGFVQIITRANKAFINSGIMFILKKIYPKVVNAFLTSDEIEETLSYFEKSNETILYHKNIVVKELLNDVGTEVKYKKGKRRIELREYKQAFTNAKLEQVWIDKIELFSEHNEYHFYIGRDGVISIYNGNYDDYIPIYEKIKQKYIQKYNFLKNRSRELLPKNELRPIRIPFEFNMFDDPSIRTKFIDMIEKYTFCNYSIEYVGNPHIHINIVDTLDYSSFSVKTYSANSLIISPQVRTTEAALLRFSSFLVNHFREITMEDFSNG